MNVLFQSGAHLSALSMTLTDLSRGPKDTSLPVHCRGVHVSIDLEQREDGHLQQSERLQRKGWKKGVHMWRRGSGGLKLIYRTCRGWWSQLKQGARAGVAGPGSIAFSL